MASPRVLACAGLILFASVGQVQAQIHQITSPIAAQDDYFGAAVGFDDGRVLVGASGEASCGEDAGAAYLYEPGADGRYLLKARIAPDNCKTGRFFGHTVALSGNAALVAGTRGFLGGSVPNPVYVFERQADGSWVESARLLPDTMEGALGFGASVALAGDRAVVTSVGDPGASVEGTAFIYERDEAGKWRLAGSISRPGAFGALAILDGDRLAVTAPRTAESGGADGGVYLFEREATGDWREIGRIGGIEEQTFRCDLDGDRLVVGRRDANHRQRGAVDVYELQPSGRWALTETLQPISAYDYGAFGTDVAVSGSRLLVVGFSEQINMPYNIDRVVYVFRKEPGAAWRQVHIIDIGSTGFGASIDLDERVALIGEVKEGEAGAAYVVSLF